MLDACQDTVGLPGCLDTLMFNLLFTKTPRLLSRGLLQCLTHQSVCIAKVCPSKVQNPLLSLVATFHVAGDCPAL